MASISHTKPSRKSVQFRFTSPLLVVGAFQAPALPRPASSAPLSLSLFSGYRGRLRLLQLLGQLHELACPPTGRLGDGLDRGAGLTCGRLRRSSVGSRETPSPANAVSDSDRSARTRVALFFEERAGSNTTFFDSGGGGIRTRVGLRPPVFKTGALNRSATPPGAACIGKPQARARLL